MRRLQVTVEPGEPLAEWTAHIAGDADKAADGLHLDWRGDTVWQSVVRDYAVLVRDGVIPAGAMLVPWQAHPSLGFSVDTSV
jgi:hypothetical protein